MSAEKCGGPVGFVQVVDAEPEVEKTDFLSGRAFRVLKKIKHKFPDFTPVNESDIWVKAYKMGLTEEE